MRKLWLIIKREYLTRVKTKTFVFSTVAVPLFTVGIFVLQIYTSRRQADRTLKIAIVDNAGGLAESIAEGLDGKLSNGQPEFVVVKTLDRPGAREQESLRAEIENGDLDAFLVVPPGVIGGAPAELHTRNASEMLFDTSLDRAVSHAVIARRLDERGIKLTDVGKAVQGVEVKLIKVSAQGETEEEGQTFIIAIAVGMLLYVTLIVYGVTTMRSVTEEKNSRVIEILVASVRPFHLLVGKILGVAAVGITQYAIWAAGAGLVATYGVTMASSLRPSASLPQLHLPWTLLVYMVVFFLCGYLLYASLYAAIGAMVSNDHEAQQAQMPVTLLIVGGFLLFNVILRDPNSPLSAGLSLIPFFAPILMMLRIAIQMPPLWQIGLSIGISVLTTIGLVYLAARIYRVGVLMYGKRPSLGELMKWLKYT
jgi:ABC-2 type transport system permease protein